MPRDASREAAPGDGASSGSAGSSSDSGTTGGAGGTDSPPFDASSCSLPAIKMDCSAGWCRVPAGCFVIGSPEDEWGRGLVNEQQARVTLTHAFSISQTEVTQAAWVARGYPNPSGSLPDGSGDCTDDPSCPVGNLTWFEAAAYANALSESERLPDCYALSGCTGVPGQGMTITRQAMLGNCYDDAALDGIAWYCQNSQGKTHHVGQKAANAFGLFDMAGNVEEWVNDRALGRAVPDPSTDPGAELANGTLREVRGGLFNAWASLCRSASHLGIDGAQRGPGLGFRLVRSAL